MALQKHSTPLHVQAVAYFFFFIKMVNVKYPTIDSGDIVKELMKVKTNCQILI